MTEINPATKRVIAMRLNNIFVRKEEINLLLEFIARRISRETGACIFPNDLKFSLISCGINFSAKKLIKIAKDLSDSS